MTAKGQATETEERRTPNETALVRATRESRKLIADQIAAALLLGFKWAETDDGYMYWSEVYGRLSRIGRDGK